MVRRLLYSVAFLAILTSPYVLSQGRPSEPHSDAKPTPNEIPIPQESTSVTQHQITVNGQVLHYTATVGNLLISRIAHDEMEEPYHSVFYVAYTLDGADSHSRPVTFLYNGGPGSATLWLHMGSVGPVRVVTDSPDATHNAPYRIVPNEYTLLTQSDLVFIDAPGTGFSRPVGKGTIKDIAGVDEDLTAFTRFIVRYLTVNHRWNSPKFLFGESYGTTRSAGLSATLNSAGVQLNGIVLLSSILNYNAGGPGLDNTHLTDLPSFAAIAWYYNKIPNKPADITSFLAKARAFASGPYAQALYSGNALTPAETDSIANQMSAFIGLSPTFIKECNLRVSPSRFRKELLRDQNDILGRYDARFGGPDAEAAGDYPGYDPSDTGITGAFVAAFQDYLQNDLKYSSKETYELQGPGLIQNWDWKHKAAGMSSGYMREQPRPYVAGDLGDTMRKNPHLHVFSANGLYDLATPFRATEWELAHMGIDQKLSKNITFGYYPAGHMVYLNVLALKSFRMDLEAFYNNSK